MFLFLLFCLFLCFLVWFYLVGSYPQGQLAFQPCCCQLTVSAEKGFEPDCDFSRQTLGCAEDKHVFLQIVRVCVCVCVMDNISATDSGSSSYVSCLHFPTGTVDLANSRQLCSTVPIQGQVSTQMSKIPCYVHLIHVDQEIDLMQAFASRAEFPKKMFTHEYPSFARTKVAFFFCLDNQPLGLASNVSFPS